MEKKVNYLMNSQTKQSLTFKWFHKQEMKFCVKNSFQNSKFWFEAKYIRLPVFQFFSISTLICHENIG